MPPAELLAWAGLLSGSGVFAGGVGFCKWCFGIERRVYRLEVKNKITV